MTEIRPRRSVLYMPASNPRAIEKARSLPCDSVILDLEDAVAPDKKDEARALMVKALAEGGFGAREMVVRINGSDTPWGGDDMDAVRETSADAVLVPKVDMADDLAEARAALGADGPVLWAMMETPLAILNAGAIAAYAARAGLTGFVMGTNDLAKELRCALAPGRAALQFALQTTLLAAKAFGIAAIDGVWNAIADHDGFIQECGQGRDMGFDGKTLIHPSQIAAANRAFAPATEDIVWAEKVAAAFDDPANTEAGALKVEGRMVERLHADMARQTLTMARAIAAREAG